MPAVTRNQRKNVANVVATKPVVPTHSSFCAETKVLLARCDSTIGKENKMRIALEIFEKVNKELPQLIAVEDQKMSWKNFAACVFNKINDFNDEYSSGNWNDIDNELVDKFVYELCKAKEFTAEIIRNYSGPCNTDLMIKAKNELERLATMRPRRNIKRVDYTGMDTIEPESEYDGITDIWADLTLSEDPDYEFEEDEDDEEEDRTRWTKIHPELSAEEKTELKQHLAKLVDHHRVRRSIARVNYAGMDMNKDDEGLFYVSKRWFEDGKVKYIWYKYSLEDVNDFDDEDYVDEE